MSVLLLALVPDVVLSVALVPDVILPVALVPAFVDALARSGAEWHLDGCREERRPPTCLGSLLVGSSADRSDPR